MTKGECLWWRSYVLRSLPLKSSLGSLVCNFMTWCFMFMVFYCEALCDLKIEGVFLQNLPEHQNSCEGWECCILSHRGGGFRKLMDRFDLVKSSSHKAHDSPRSSVKLQVKLYVHNAWLTATQYECLFLLQGNDADTAHTETLRNHCCKIFCFISWCLHVLTFLSDSSFL